MMNQTASATSSCPRCRSPLEAGDLRCAICGQATPAERTPRTQALEVKILRCTGCGAALAYDPEHQAPSCSFCGEVVRVESVDDPMEQTEHYLPFTVTAEEARRALRTWLGSRGWFRPSDLSARAQLTELKPLWWVAWVFDAEAFLSWAADSNAGARRSAWAPHAGQNQVHFDDLLVSASRGLTHQETSAITPGMDLSTKRPTPEGAGPQAMLEQFDLQRSQARQYLLGAIERISHQRVQSQFIPGTRFRNVKVSVVLRSLITRRLSLPAYVLAYRYKGDLYRVVICGQDRRLVVGDSPRSLIKMIGVGLATALLVLIVLAAVAGG